MEFGTKIMVCTLVAAALVAGIYSAMVQYDICRQAGYSKFTCFVLSGR